MAGKPLYLSHASITGPFPILIRNILKQEQIQVVHGHQQTSTMGINIMNIAYAMDLPFVLSQHSLHDTDGFTDNLISSVYCSFNRLMVDKIICVSNIVQENLVIRTGVEVEKTIVIPNAIDTEYYKEIPSVVKQQDKIVIVVLSRLTQRKGVDLLL